VQERRVKISWMVEANDGFAWMVRVSVPEPELEVGLSLEHAARERVRNKTT
jgi:hypothetical protein